MKTLLLAIALFFSSAWAMGIPVKLKFQILDELGTPVKGTQVTLYQKNDVVVQKDVKGSHAVIWLEEDAYYTLEIAKDAYVVKRIGIRTRVSNEDLEVILDNRFIFFVELEHQSKYARFEHPEYYTDFPAALVEYDATEGVFDYNQRYWLSTKRDYAILRTTLRTIEF